MKKSIEQLEKENSELYDKLRTYRDFAKSAPANSTVGVSLNLEQLNILVDLVAERSGNI